MRRQHRNSRRLLKDPVGWESPLGQQDVSRANVTLMQSLAGFHKWSWGRPISARGQHLRHCRKEFRFQVLLAERHWRRSITPQEEKI